MALTIPKGSQKGASFQKHPEGRARIPCTIPPPPRQPFCDPSGVELLFEWFPEVGLAPNAPATFWHASRHASGQRKDGPVGRLGTTNPGEWLKLHAAPVRSGDRPPIGVV